MKQNISQLNKSELFALAKDENTPANILEELASQTEDFEINGAIAKNPNTPINLLIFLCKKHSEQVINNPALSLILLEEPDFLDILYCWGTGVFSNAQKLPQIVWEWAKSNPNSDFIKALVYNDIVPQTVLTFLAKSSDTRVRVNVVCHPNTNQETLEFLAKDPDRDVRAKVAKKIPKKSILELLAKDSDSWVRGGVACNHFSSVKILQNLAQEQDFFVKVGLSQNPRLRLLKKIQFKIYFESDYRIRRYIAKTNSTIPTILTNLSKDFNRDVRIAVAENQTTPTWCLTKLSLQDRSRLVRLAAITNLARKRNTSSIEDSYFGRLLLDELFTERELDFIKKITQGEVVVNGEVDRVTIGSRRSLGFC